MSKDRTSPADVNRALAEAARDPICGGCGTRITPGSGYCTPCGEAVNRLVARGVYFSDHSPKEWRAAIAEEREAVQS